MEIFFAAMIALSAGSIWDEVVEPDLPPPELYEITVQKGDSFWPADTVPLPPTKEEEKDDAEESQDQDAFWPPDMIPHPTVPGDSPSGPGEPELA